MVEVVAALIWDKDKFMICQRPAHKARGLLWEFVGGKVEPGVTKEQALIRECQEELAITLSVGDVFMDVVHEYPDINVHLTLFNATIAEGVPQKLEHNEIKWITPAEIPNYDFCPADEEILEKIKTVFRGDFMPNMNWSKLNSLQLGRYAEYYAKMEFASYGFEVYTSEVDDHGVDFIAKLPGENRFYEVQVKSLREYGYIFMAKSKMPELSDESLICFLHFIDGKLPDVFVIPASAWKNPNTILVDRKYDKPGQKSEPEWGVNVSKKNYNLLSKYSADNWLERKFK